MIYQPRLDVYMSIIGILILAINYATMVITFPRKHKMLYGILAMILLTVAVTVYRRLTVDLIYWNALATLFYLALMLWLLRGSFFQLTFAYYFQYIFAIVQLYLMETVVSIFVPKNAEHFTLILFILMLISYSVYIFLTYKYGRTLFRKLLDGGRQTDWILYALGALYSFVILTISRDYPNTALLNITLLLFIVWSFAVLCFAIINTHEKSKQRYEAEFAREVISSGREHYQKMDETHDKLRTLRHDYKYHLIAIDEYLTDGNKDELKRYLEGMKTQLSESELHNFCTNSVINALLVRYAERCVKSQIAFTVDIDLPDTLSVPNYDLCIMVGNLLENAVEACQKQPDGRNIEIILKPLGQQLVLRVKNSYDGRVFESGGRLKSMKKDGGFGLRSIEAVAARYDGELLLDWQDGIFSAYVTMRL